VTEDTLALQMTVRGRVQGVFFRDSTRREAQRRAVAGWAANCADGSVEVVLEGRPGAVRELVAYIERGPGRAQVTGVQLAPRAVQGLRGFDVR
jgi:acylphosphatase